MRAVNGLGRAQKNAICIPRMYVEIIITNNYNTVIREIIKNISQARFNSKKLNKLTRYVYNYPSQNNCVSLRVEPLLVPFLPSLASHRYFPPSLAHAHYEEKINY